MRKTTRLALVTLALACARSAAGAESVSDDFESPLDTPTKWQPGPTLVAKSEMKTGDTTTGWLVLGEDRAAGSASLVLPNAPWSKSTVTLSGVRLADGDHQVRAITLRVSGSGTTVLARLRTLKKTRTEARETMLAVHVLGVAPIWKPCSDILLDGTNDLVLSIKNKKAELKFGSGTVWASDSIDVPDTFETQSCRVELIGNSNSTARLGVNGILATDS